MAHTIEGNETVGFRVIDSEIGPLTARCNTEQEALDAAGIKPPKKTTSAKR